MLAELTVAALTLSAQLGQADREVAAPEPAWVAPTCDESDGLPLAGSSHQTGTSAPPGGAWWLDRTDSSSATLLADPYALELVAGDGSVEVVELYPTPLALAVPVPEGAMNGASYILRRTTGGGGLVLRVEGEPARPAAFELGELAVGEPVPASCEAECYEPGYTIPGKVTLDLAFDGDPVVVDAWVKLDGTSPHHLDDRTLDSALVVPEELSGPIVVSGDFYGPLDYTLYVTIRDPNTLELLHEVALTPEAPLPALEFEQGDLPLCSDYYGYDDDCCYDPGPCGAYGTEVPLGLLGLLGGLAVVRRRRRA